MNNASHVAQNVYGFCLPMQLFIDHWRRVASNHMRNEHDNFLSVISIHNAFHFELTLAHIKW